ncbi:MAG: Ig-like domain-containing protein [Clostridiales bacterium]
MVKKMFLVFTFLFSSLIIFTSAYGENDLKYLNSALTLNKLGLFDGVSNSNFDPGLNYTLNRETGVALVLKVIGYKKDALKLTDQETDSILKEKAKDNSKISSWAKKYIAYAYKIGTIEGRTDGNFSPGDGLTGRDLSTMFLRELGVEVSAKRWESACFLLSQRGTFPIGEAERLNTKYLIRDDMVGIAFHVLNTFDSQDEILIKRLVRNGIVNYKMAIDNGFEVREIQSLDIITEIKVNVGEEVNLPTSVKAIFTDGTEDYVEVEWEYVETQFAGEKTIFGVVKNFNKEIIVKCIIENKNIYVKNVEALNLKQLKIDFNKVLDEISSLDENNYIVYNNEKSIISSPYQLKLDQSGSSVILTLDENSDSKKFSNNSKAKLVVKKDISDIDGNLMDNDNTISGIDIKDIKKPEIVDVQQLNKNTIKVFFSEPVIDISGDSIIENLSIDNNLYNIDSIIKNSLSNMYIEIILDKELENGDHTISVNTEDNNDLGDFAGNMIESGFTLMFSTYIVD